MYIPWPDNTDIYALRSQLVDLIGDYMYFAPSHEVADIHSLVVPVYMYEFAHRSNVVSYGAKWMGVVHADNVAYDFGIPLLTTLPFKYDTADKNVSLFIMAMYVNFARFGDPNPQLVSGITLEKFNSTQRAYLIVDVSPKMAASFYPRRMAFWNDYYPKLAQLNIDTKKDMVSGVATETLSQTVLVILAMFSLQAYFTK